MATRNIAKLEQAIVEFTKATDLDPAFALAWVGLADSSMLLWNYGSRSGEETYRIMEEAVNRALAIDPGLGEAYATLGQIHEYYGRYEEMEAAYRKATELSPNYATAWHWYSIAVSQSNLRAQEAVDLARRAAELDPRAPIIGTNLASTYQAQGLLSLAERQFRSIIELNPDFAQAYGGLAIMKVFHMGQLDEALTLLAAGREIDPGNAVLPVLAAITLTELGDLEAAEQLQREFEATNPNDWRIGWVGQNINATRKNAAGMREAANWMLDRVSGVPFAINLTGLLELAYGDVQRAREIYLRGNPGWTDSSRWNQLIERDPTNACVMAWVLAHTGDERLGNDLLSKALDFHTQALPAAVEHPDASKPDICHLMAGDTESALASLETQLAHNHIFWLGHYGQLPMYEAIRHEPRYQAVMAEYDRRIAEQAERAAQMKLDIQS